MAQPAFGLLLQALREQRGFSLRELGQLSGVDHAYIYRLETGDKESPSEETLSKLIRALKAGKREADMLRYLAEHPDTDPGLVQYVFEEQSVPFGVFAAAASANFRGTARPEYKKLVERVRRILDEDHGVD